MATKPIETTQYALASARLGLGLFSESSWDRYAAALEATAVAKKTQRDARIAGRVTGYKPKTRRSVLLESTQCVQRRG